MSCRFQVEPSTRQWQILRETTPAVWHFSCRTQSHVRFITSAGSWNTSVPSGGQSTCKLLSKVPKPQRPWIRQGTVQRMALLGTRRSSSTMRRSSSAWTDTYQNQHQNLSIVFRRCSFCHLPSLSRSFARVKGKSKPFTAERRSDWFYISSSAVHILVDLPWASLCKRANTIDH